MVTQTLPQTILHACPCALFYINMSISLMEAGNAGEHLNTCMCVLVHPHTLMPVGSTDSGRIRGVSSTCVHICRVEYARLRG